MEGAMFEFLSKLFGTEDFPARWSCGNWTEGHGWLHIISDILVFGAYTAIPVALGYYLYIKKRELVFPRIFWLFAAFILACGLTHLIEATIFWQPWYRLSGLMKLATAVVSWWTVVALVQIAPTALNLPGLAEVNRKLEEQIDAHRVAEEKLENTNAELQEFTQVVSHDLKSPIASAVLIASMIQEQAANPNRTPEQNAQYEDLLKQLVSILDRSAELVNRLHEYALIGERERTLTQVDLNPLLAEVQMGLRRMIDESNAEISIPQELPTVLGDRLSLFQVFSNVIENAVKYRGSEPLIILITAQRADTNWLISIKDNGIGIPQEKIHSIFDPFVRVDKDSLVTGSGMGLAVCAKLMRLTGGQITANSTLGGGSEFTLRIPTVAAVTSEESAPGAGV